MTIKDDIKAINKDIKEAKDWEQMVQRAKYWLVRLKNIYPDYEFKTYFTPLREGTTRKRGLQRWERMADRTLNTTRTGRFDNCTTEVF